MKYIGTKDGNIWKSCNLTENSKDLWEGFFVKGNYIYEKIRHWEYDEKYKIEYHKVSEIINQADTIEELCDLFVIDLISINKKSIFSSKMPLQKGCEIHKDYEQFGAIWTDKGLIYVAKMNEKGELELL